MRGKLKARSRLVRNIIKEKGFIFRHVPQYPAGNMAVGKGLMRLTGRCIPEFSRDSRKDNLLELL